MAMTSTRTFTTVSLAALGAAVFSLAILQSAPAEARRAGVHSRIAKPHGVQPLNRRLTSHRPKSNKSLTGGGNNAGVGNIPKTAPINPNGGQTTGVGNVAKTAPFNPNGGAAPINPTGGQTTTSVDKIPTTHFNPSGGLPGDGNVPYTPPINPGGQAPNSPNSGQTNTGAGNVPHTPPIYPGGPKTMPLDPSGGPKPVPVPIDPNGGQTTTGGGNLPHTPPINPNGWHNAPDGGQHKQVGAYVDTGANGDHPCWWLKRKYDQTGNVDWFNRYRQCLSWHSSD